MSQMWVDADGNPPPPEVAAIFATADRLDGPAQPTPEQCNQRAQVGENLWAFWWPQMGGYHAKAVVQSEPQGCCQDVWVWHDGEFPFGGDRQPARIHMGDPADWEDMGHWLGSLPQSRIEDE